MKSPSTPYVDAERPSTTCIHTLTAIDIPHKKTRQTHVWNRISDHDPKPDISHQSSSINNQPSHFRSCEPRIPTVQTTLPEDDEATRKPSLHHPGPNLVNKNALSQNYQGLQFANLLPPTEHCSLPRLAKVPRKFLFTRSTTASSTPSIRSPSVRHSGIQKSKKKQTKDFAVFVERTYEFEISNPWSANRSAAVEDSDKPTSNRPKPSDAPSTPRKRPLASPAERKWRAQTWRKPLESKVKAAPDPTSSSGNIAETEEAVNASLGLARELQQFAFKETQAASAASHGMVKPGVKLKPKPKPKPPTPRPTKHQLDRPRINGNAHEDAMSVEEDGDGLDAFVFDMYLRQADYIAEDSAALPNANLETVNPDKVGLLVIEDEDQALWELYGEEDQSSDEGWNSEEEDENGPYILNDH